MIIAVVAQTKARAKQLADELGIEKPWVFGAQNVGLMIEGLRVDRALIDTDAKLSEHAMQTILGTTLKTPGGTVSFVAVRRGAG
jgi:hypothetical protein